MTGSSDTGHCRHSGIREYGLHYNISVVAYCVVFLGYGFLFSQGSFVRGYQKARRLFETTFVVLFGLAGHKILTTRLI
ncbi:MAG: threonine/homoserine/homoserine lactone efflux protein [Yoonia sp.]|jgi:threonine/homoserine/homoserine lactone efflux protein